MLRAIVERAHDVKHAAWLRCCGTIVRVDTQRPVAALTFDDGPHPVYTPEVLKLLERYHAHATFFMVGEAAAQHPELVRQVAQAGHAIGNHTWGHPVFPLLSRQERRSELRKCKAALAPYGSRLFRPPFGGQTRQSRLDAALLGYRSVTWDVVAFDWTDERPEVMADHVIKKLQPGSIAVFHDAIFRSIQEKPQYDRSSTLGALERVLEWSHGRFSFLTLPELLRQGRPVLADWISMPPPEYLQRLRPRTLEAVGEK